MLNIVAEAAQFLAIWRAAESGATQETDSPAELKGAAAMAHQKFIEAANKVAFELVAYLIGMEADEFTARTEVRYSAFAGEGGIIIQKMDLDPDNPGVFLLPDEASTENFLQLIIDLPELLEVLRVR